MISGLSHITLIVNNLKKTKYFLESIFDAHEIYSSDENNFSLSNEKFFMLGDLWVCIMEGDALNERTYNHIAFKIDEKDFDTYLSLLDKLHVDIKPSRERISGEGRSIYFYDYDNHLFELHTGTLPERLLSYKDHP